MECSVGLGVARVTGRIIVSVVEGGGIRPPLLPRSETENATKISEGVDIAM